MNNSFITLELFFNNSRINLCINLAVNKWQLYIQVDLIKIPYYAHKGIFFKILIFKWIILFYTEIQLVNKCSNKRSLKIYI